MGPMSYLVNRIFPGKYFKTIIDLLNEFPLMLLSVKFTLFYLVLKNLGCSISVFLKRILHTAKYTKKPCIFSR